MTVKPWHYLGLLLCAGGIVAQLASKRMYAQAAVFIAQGSEQFAHQATRWGNGAELTALCLLLAGMLAGAVSSVRREGAHAWVLLLLVAAFVLIWFILV
jgi:hypothetical protein